MFRSPPRTIHLPAFNVDTNNLPNYTAFTGGARLRRLKLIGVIFRTLTEAAHLACARDLLPALYAGRIQMSIDRTYPLEEIAQAHAYLETDQHFGKIVLTVRESTHGSLESPA